MASALALRFLKRVCGAYSGSVVSGRVWTCPLPMFLRFLNIDARLLWCTCKVFVVFDTVTPLVTI